ncbi:hypothetical protein HBI70_166780 [Parastagonospora nodorum]|nr:hypothetical protein HBI76_076540 [Parastagonospora nodorum]KAH5115929.1 hypothetical protein HBH71_128420 [Parastagonospora nodorum]KAH5260668.1 hypothetical protein HBI70_166780 [Parastagonospora nodorum]
MTRPHIIRADTLDLQDKSSPTAQDHSSQPEHPAPLGIGPAAPHQQASLRHVEEERDAEEAKLQNAWSHAGTDLRDDPGSDDERTVVNHKDNQQDEQAIRLNGGAGDGDGDDSDMQDADVEEDMDDDMMDKISSSPSIDDEDIDFEFVYALHTFVATVEGQANATKGDTMVLLDDSNSYWWLVRVVKDSSIGYLPAEHIETPTERLARLNKHRNIDLSATMLGDTAEKSKNPLKKAMRRRNAKTVQFAPPTYVEASDYDYSSDEDCGELFGGPDPKQAQQQQQQQQDTEKAETETQEDLQVQPLKVGGAKKDGKSEGDVRVSGEEAGNGDDKQRGSDDVDRPLDPKVSRNGTLRNTDSFFKDENTETRKITLTPNLLRDDSSTSTTGSRERGPSLESLEKNGFADKVKDDKKKKEKKAGMLSGLFKRKDKKVKQDSIDSDIDSKEELDRGSPQPKPSEESAERSSAEQLGPQRSTSKGKLQKARSRDDSPQKTKGILKTDSPTEASSQPTASPDALDSKPTGQQPPTMRMVPSEQEEAPAAEVKATASKNPFRSQPKTEAEPKPERVTKAKQRMQLDDFDTSDEDDDPFADPDAQTKSAQSEAAEPTGRLSESPVQISAADAQPASKAQAREKEREADSHQPPGLAHDSSSQETSSPVSTPTPDDSPMRTIPENTTLIIPRSERTGSPTLLSPTTATPGPPPSRPAPMPTKADRDVQPSPPTSSESSQLPAWSDAALRAYLDDGSDVRDMLLVVSDTTGVVPVGRDHPIMSTLFVEESKRVQGMSTELDRLLSGLMEKRMKRNGSAASSKASTGRSGSGLR